VDSAEDKRIREALAIMVNPINHPVLIHCSFGRDRTGLVAALYRVLFQGWTPEKARAEWLALGHGGFMHQLFDGNLDKYFKTTAIEFAQKAKTPNIRQIVIDAKGHLLGRLASVVAKQLLEGHHICCVRCEGLCQSGKFLRNKYKFAIFLGRRRSANPRKGHHHHRSPSAIFYRAIRGMIPHKTDRGKRALGRLKVVEGIPPPYDRQQRMVVPRALRVLRLKPGRKWTDIGRLATEVGWRYGETVKRLEEKRKTKGEKQKDRLRQFRKFRMQAQLEGNKAVTAEQKLVLDSVRVGHGK